MAYELRDFSGIAAATTLASDITDSATSITLTSGTGWPTGGAGGDFFLRISSEVIRCSSRTGTAVTVASSGRGYDGTTAVAHTSGETIEHVISETDLAEANHAVSQTVGKVTTAEDILVATGANTFKRLGKGSNGHILQVLAGALAYGALPTDSVGSAQIAANAVGISEITAAGRYKEVIFSKNGVLTTGTGTFRWYAKVATTIVDVWISVGVAPTGAALTVDVNHNGTTIFTTQGNRPSISASAFFDEAGAADGDVTLAAGEYLTVDIDQVGSTIAGSDLVVGVRYYET